MTMQFEAFIYLWYVAKTKKFYLGKHLGSPDDIYTHSSYSKEFCNIVPNRKQKKLMREFLKNIPKGIKRRIIAKGTNEEMSEFEIKLLKNRYDKCWDRYYNISWHHKALGSAYNFLSEQEIKKWKTNLSIGGKKRYEGKKGEERKKEIGKFVKKFNQTEDGKRANESRKRKVKESKIKYWSDPQKRKEASKRNKGRKISEEHKKNNSLAQIKLHQDNLEKKKKNFLKKAKLIHDNKYDYSKVDYKGQLHHVIIICKKHGEFLQTPTSHLTGRGGSGKFGKGNGCPKCGIEKTLPNLFLGRSEYWVGKPKRTLEEKKEYRRKWTAAWRKKKKIKQGQGTLEEFMK